MFEFFENMIFLSAHPEISLLKVHIYLLKFKPLTLSMDGQLIDHSLEL
jgi:hypothetical protein